HKLATIATRHQSAYETPCPLFSSRYDKLPRKRLIWAARICIGTRNFTERYYRDKTGWLKVSARGRTFPMTAEQVLNHVLPALAGIKPNLTTNQSQHAKPPSRKHTKASLKS